MTGADPKKAQTTKTPPEPPRIPSGQEIYDAIMGRIEPELLSVNLPTLEEKYGDEPEDQKKERLRRYERAFQEYDSAYALYIADVREKVRRYRQLSFSWAEKKSRSDEDGSLTELEQRFS